MIQLKMPSFKTNPILLSILLIASALFAAFILPCAAAVGVAPSKVTLQYLPGVEQRVDIRLFSDVPVMSFLKGDFADYARIIDPDQGGFSRTITVVINLPEGLPSGRHTLLAGAVESKPQSTGAIVAKIAIVSKIMVNIPYPGVHIEASLNAQNINVGEKETFAVTVTNLGLDGASGVSARVEVFDAENNKIAEIAASDERYLAGMSESVFELEWDSSAAKAGNYNAVAIVSYAGGSPVATKETGFKVGSLDLSIVDYTREFEANSITPFFIEVKSGWNGLITGVYGEIIVDSRGFRTLTSDINPWQQMKLTGYLDSNGIAGGEYDAKFIVYYAGATAEKTDKITIARGLAPEKEMPAGVGEAGFIPTDTAVLLLAAVFAAAVVLLVLIYLKRKPA